MSRYAVFAVLALCLVSVQGQTLLDLLQDAALTPYLGQLSTSVCLSTDASLLASVDIGGPCPTIVQGIENLSNGGTAPAQSCTAECKATINKFSPACVASLRSILTTTVAGSGVGPMTTEFFNDCDQ
ncbi:hypothetical protein H632_c2371p0, partial [Helicosporidium sp. ATCC 50920]